MNGTVAGFKLEWPPPPRPSVSEQAEAFFEDDSPAKFSRLSFLRPVCLLALAVLAGAGLRLLWAEDIEYKADEAWTFAQTRPTSTEPFSWLGMPTSVSTSVEIRNPGMSVWVFQLLAHIFQIDSPVELARCVQWLGIAATVALALFASLCVRKQEREPWLWAAALMSVNPLAVLFERKIWPPSLLPIFVVAFIAAWWHRRHSPAAFLWGLLGTLMGQIHLAAFFFAVGFAAWIICFARRGVAWFSWAAGSIVGALPLLPWLRYFWFRWESHRGLPHGIHHCLEFKFWTRWAMEPLGLGLSHPLGREFDQFLRYPLIHGFPTFGVGLLHALVIATGFWIFARAGLAAIRMPGPWKRQLSESASDTALVINAGLWGYGLSLTLSLLPIHRHYMIVAYPLEALWLSRLSLQRPRLTQGRRLLGALCVAQFLLSLSFLGYIHVNQGVRNADYGIAYAAQIQEGSKN